MVVLVVTLVVCCVVLVPVLSPDGDAEEPLLLGLPPLGEPPPVAVELSLGLPLLGEPPPVPVPSPWLVVVFVDLVVVEVPSAGLGVTFETGASIGGRTLVVVVGSGGRTLDESLWDVTFEKKPAGCTLLSGPAPRAT